MNTNTNKGDILADKITNVMALYAPIDTRVKAALERALAEYRAEVERLKSACEMEFASVEQLDLECSQLKADKARLDFLEKTSCAQYLEGPCAWAINSWSEPLGETLRDAIDAAMKGAE